jgi:hypothetical protein
LSFETLPVTLSVPLFLISLFNSWPLQFKNQWSLIFSPI